MNQVALVGNITDDPKLRYTQSGAALAGFTVAVSHRRWVPPSVDPSGHATSTAKSEKQNSYGSSRAASQPSDNEDRRRSDEKHNGEWQDVNDGFFRCTAWRSVAENASRTLKKGMRVMVIGKLVQRSWQDNDGASVTPSRSRSPTWARTSSSQLPRSRSPPQTVRSRPRTVLRLRPRPRRSGRSSVCGLLEAPAGCRGLHRDDFRSRPPSY